MRKLALLMAMLGMLAAAPARATTTTWAKFAVASSQYSTNYVEGGLLGALNPLINFLLPTVFCLVDTQTLCPPGPPPAPGDVLQAFTDGINNGVNDGVYGPWSAMQATGAPNTYPSCGDIPTAWAPQLHSSPAPTPANNEPEALAVFYSRAITGAKRIDIYETNLGGFVQRVEVVLANGKSLRVFWGPDTTPCPGVLRIPVSVSGAIVGVVIHTKKIGWEEIDAVGIVH